MLILFDIDGTLLLTGGAGVRAMELAGKDLYGPEFSVAGIDFAGRIDTLLIKELLVHNGVVESHDECRRFREAYAKRLAAGPLVSPEGRATGALPGVIGLLDALAGTAATLGVLTGNFEETGRLKLEASGISPGRFKVFAWGDDSPHDPPHRDHLPPVAIKRASGVAGREFVGSEVVIIGDTPHDVRCARVNSCRSLGVGTGRYSVDELSAAGAEKAVRDLTDTLGLVDWLLNQT